MSLPGAHGFPDHVPAIVREPSGHPPTKPRLLDRVRFAVRARHYSRRTEKAYVHWIRKFILFHDKRHPNEMGEDEVTRFLSNLATVGGISASTQNQAMSAILFLYRDVLHRSLERMDDIVRAKRPRRIPVVLTREEGESVLGRLRGVYWLMASLMFGAGLRLLECCRLRVKDVDFERNEITVRDGKGRKDRVTMLPARIKPSLAAHIGRVRAQHQRDRKHGRGSIAPQIPERIPRMVLAVGVSGHPALPRPADRRTSQAPRSRIDGPAGRQGSRAPDRHSETGELPHAASHLRDCAS
jgi:integrase